MSENNNNEITNNASLNNDEAPKAEPANQEIKEAANVSDASNDDAKTQTSDEISATNAPKAEPANEDSKETANVSDASNDDAKTQTSDANSPTDAPKTEVARAPIPKHHFSAIDAFLSVCAVLFVACAIGMVIPAVQPFALYGGYVVAFIFICGIFYATLHLQKV